MHVVPEKWPSPSHGGFFVVSSPPPQSLCRNYSFGSYFLLKHLAFETPVHVYVLGLVFQLSNATTCTV